MSTRKSSVIQSPLLATVLPLPIQSLEHRTRDLLHTLNAAGITATDAQACVLAERGMTGLGCWTPSRALRDFDRAVNQHFSIARHVQRVVEASNIWSTRKEITR